MQRARQSSTHDVMLWSSRSNTISVSKNAATLPLSSMPLQVARDAERRQLRRQAMETLRGTPGVDMTEDVEKKPWETWGERECAVGDV